MKLHYVAIAAVTAISANIGTASAAVSFLSINTTQMGHNYDLIILPLKGEMIKNGAFFDCPKLDEVEIVGGMESVVAS